MRRFILPALVVLVYLIIGALYAIYTPAWQAPDEPAHYNYVRQLAGGTFPVMESGDYDQAYLTTIVGSRFDPAYPVELLTYEDWQPPLYYLLQTPAFRLTSGSLIALRLMSLLLGAGVVLLVYAAGRLLFPHKEWLALGAAVFVAFLPQHLAILTSVNNDSLAELLIAAILVLLIAPWPDERPAGRLLGLGLLLGLGFVAKGTVYLMAPVIGLFLFVHYWRRWRDLVWGLALVFGPALVLGSLWWSHNVAVYGAFDILARERHDAVVVGQPRTAEWIAQFGLGETIRRFVQTSFNSFWGQFGWMAAPLPGWAYWPLLLISLAAGLGLILARVDRRKTPADERIPLTSMLVLLATVVTTVGLHVGYNLTFVQHQGRYLFPALLPIGVGVAAGLGYWLQPLCRRYPAAGYLLPLGLALLLIPLSLFSLFRIIIPYLTPP